MRGFYEKTCSEFSKRKHSRKPKEIALLYNLTCNITKTKRRLFLLKSRFRSFLRPFTLKTNKESRT
ncbi:MAG TPA: hypothetical protein DD384_00310 [Firmicutes bacterium]|nr:hypothetical protein [Bacillota bacterium]